MVYEEVTGPIGPRRGDIQAAIVAAAVTNASRGKRGRVARPEDFLPNWDPRGRAAQEQSPQDQLSQIRQITRAMGGRDLTRGGGDVDVAGPADQDRRRPVRR